MQAVVVTFEHLALWSLGCYGNTWVRTPHFDQLAAGSVVFDQCHASPSAGDAFAGLSQLAAALRDHGGAAILFRQDEGDLPNAIADWQQATARHEQALLWLHFHAISSPWIAPQHQISSSWAKACDAEALYVALTAALNTPPDRNASPDSWLLAALPQLLTDGLLDRANFAATPAIGRLRRVIYTAAVSTLDAWLGHVIGLVQAASSPDALLIVAAAGGDLTGPHAQMASGCPPLIEPLVHVPLLIRTGTQADGTRRNALTSIDDIAPTIAELFHVKHDARCDSRSLCPVLRDGTDEVRTSLLLGSAQLGWSLRTKEFACLCRPLVAQQGFGESVDSESDRPRLFVKPDDAWDTLDVASQYPDVTARMVDQIWSESGSDSRLQSEPKRDVN